MSSSGIFKDCSSVSGIFGLLDSADEDTTNFKVSAAFCPTAHHSQKHLYLLLILIILTSKDSHFLKSTGFIEKHMMFELFTQDMVTFLVRSSKKKIIFYFINVIIMMKLKTD